MNDVFGKTELTHTNGTAAVSLSRWGVDARRWMFPLAVTALVVSLYPTQSVAAGSRAGVEARPGEIVLLRAVPARPAVRDVPPGRALLVDPSPKSELEQGLSQREISPAGYGQVAAGTGNAPSMGAGMSGSITSITQHLGGSTQTRNGAPSAAGGAMGAATGSIGSTVTGALSGAGLLGAGGQR
ncbi:MAG: hypothetical protein JXJ30_07530 [Halothiobacillaceae bacterium]|nr:hypothetical protein [Halothiobacillaceae bacterium]HER33856.1 hypothetical protein [Halothiobacillaceae bacterium]